MAWCARRLSATIPRTTAIFRSGLSGDTGATSPPCGKQKPLWWPIWRWGVLWEPSRYASADLDTVWPWRWRSSSRTYIPRDIYHTGHVRGAGVVRRGNALTAAESQPPGLVIAEGEVGASSASPQGQA